MTADGIWQFVFWLSLVGVAYIYIGYPLLVCALARWRPLQTVKQRNEQPVSIVVVAYNEGARLREKIDSILSSDDAALIREVLIASDGSDDNTAEAVNSIDDPRVRLLNYPIRRGKPSVLNDTIPQCACEFIVLTDARQELAPQAIAELTAHFADETVGAVSGKLVLKSSGDVSTASHGIGVYWRYEKFIRVCEGRFRSVPGASGALYALRRSLFQPIPSQTILDDVVIPMQAVTAGFRCLFESNAIAFDFPATSARKESIRKRRTIAGAAQLIVNHPDWLLPWHNPIWFEFVSHKILRLTSPLLLVIAMLSNILLCDHDLYLMLLVWHIGFYGSALIGWCFQQSGYRSVFFGAQFMFLALNAITTAAIVDALRGRFRSTWQRTT